MQGKLQDDKQQQQQKMRRKNDEIRFKCPITGFRFVNGVKKCVYCECTHGMYLCNAFIPAFDNFTATDNEFEWLATVS